jgi:transposase
MARSLRITIEESREELEHRLHHTSTASNKEKLQMLYWLKTGQAQNRQQLVKLLNRSEATITRWLNCYRKQGINVLLTIQTPPGAPSKIPPEIAESLFQRLQNPEGFCSYRDIQQWLAEACALEVSYTTVYKLVHDRWQAKLKVPRPQSSKQSPEALEPFRSHLAPALAALQTVVGCEHPWCYVCEDESRFGRITQRGRVITLKGVKPSGSVQWSRENFYVYGLVEPLTGEYFVERLPKLNSENFQIFINDLARKYSDRIVVLQLDRASFHCSKQVDWPENIIPILQPAHAPELNPIERFWQYIKYPLRWQNFKNLEQLWRRIQEILGQLTTEIVRSLTGWDFIVNAVLSATS